MKANSVITSCKHFFAIYKFSPTLMNKSNYRVSSLCLAFPFCYGFVLSQTIVVLVLKDRKSWLVFHLSFICWSLLLKTVKLIGTVTVRKDDAIGTSWSFTLFNLSISNNILKYYSKLEIWEFTLIFVSLLIILCLKSLRIKQFLWKYTIYTNTSILISECILNKYKHTEDRPWKVKKIYSFTSSPLIL